jgi:hypothetical protein
MKCQWKDAHVSLALSLVAQNTMRRLLASRGRSKIGDGAALCTNIWKLVHATQTTTVSNLNHITSFQNQ